METIKSNKNDRLQQHHILYKMKTPPWKETFRMKCFQRFKNNRGKLVDKFRGLDFSSDETIDVLMKEDWRTATGKNTLSACLSSSVEEIEDAEVNEFISIMEQIQREMLEEERKYLEEFAALEDESLASTVDWLERDEVICPLCKKNILHQVRSVIFCLCGMRIDTKQDGLTIRHLKDELHRGIESHEQSCSASPDFSLLTIPNDTNLTITCSVCSFMYIVI